MAEQITHDVVNEAQSMGGPSPIDVNATTTNESSAGAAPDTNSSNQDQPATSSTNATSSSAPPPTTNPSEPSDAAKASPIPDGSQRQPATDAVSETPKEPTANGTASPLPSLDDPSGTQSAADTSGGSDTDTSRAGKDGTRSTVKKPTSFKSVSVTKHFLAKTAVSTPAKVGEKAPISQTSVPAQPTAKPRLVAKSGSGVGSALGRSSLSKLNGAGTGPDPNMVWNKNRPTPPPPPKQFTDEELKQQFGIHMATRLQADEDQKESKWADIDEDEDDNWAPETVEWMDGTKSTVKPAEPTPPLEEPKPEAKKEDKPAEESKPTTPSLSRPSSTGPSLTGGTKTILKPGAHSAAGGIRQGGLLSKGQTDSGKPTLVSKSPAPAPAKSPWAPLPPVERVSPVVINPQPEHPPVPRFSQKDPHGFDALPPAPSPAKEIAADDFNRSWRDDRGPRELFNSQSGRYEPHSSPVAAHVQPESPQPVAGSPASPDAVNGGANPMAAYQEQVKIQEQMMREKIERARAEKQKRREEEEKEEAARKERLRLKLEALGPPPSKADKPKSPTAGSEPPQAQQKPTTIQSPPKPPIPTAEGEVAQYGMMKVHQPHSVKRTGEHLRPSEQSRREVKSPERKAVSPAKSPAAPAAETTKAQPDGVSTPDEAAPQLEQKVPAWKPSVASGTPWAPLRSRNVWGPPNQERGIGNGTFGHTQQPPPAAAPGPIAPPAATTKLPTSPPRFTHPPSAEQPSSSSSSTFASQPDLRSQDSFAHPPAAMASAAVAPGPIGPPKSAPRPAFDVSAWSASSIAESDAKLARRREENYQANRGKPLPAFNETFKQTAIEGSLDRRRVLETKSTVHLHPNNVSKPDEQAPHTSHSEQSSRSTPIPFGEPYKSSVGDEPSTLRPIGSEKVQSSPGSTGTSGNRSSRFFPRTQDAFDAVQATVSQLILNGDSPPPPETSSHPVFTGDALHPIVKLPQKIKVKLPPAASHSSSPVIMPARPGFSRLGSQPIIQQPGWQERINGLLGRASAPAPSPPKPATSLAVAPASKAPYDHTGPRAGATVSLPSKPALVMFASGYNASPVSKSAFEEVMSVPEAFSAPTVCLPKEPHMNAGLAPVAPPATRPGSRFYKTTDAFSIDPTFSPIAECEQNAQGIIITIHMPASDAVKTRIMARRRNQGRKPSGYNNKKRNMAPRENSNSGSRPRKTSGNVPQGHPWSNSNKSNSPSSPWGRRPSGAVH
ncbi:hypothetical protein BFW01_g6211 [Lasiodiplodia theobromae]|nr:hypothetical protein BFW01_g6211 [Lasiodiplodia theobromae]